MACFLFSGGISIKPAAKMDLMRGDMGGAACVAGAILTAAKLKLPVNLLGTSINLSCVGGTEIRSF